MENDAEKNLTAVPSPKSSASWDKLRQFTAARIGLGRAGAGIPTGETLGFKLAHAQARDAVHATLDFGKLSTELGAIHPWPVLILKSHAKDRSEYLRRPDFGRRLSEDSRQYLERQPPTDCDLAIVFADGLSALAIELNAGPFLKEFLPLIPEFRVAPIVLVEQGRVAIGDEIGSLLNAKCVVVLIGERPGLSSPDSMGAYLTFEPRPGLTDERRNCISNIRVEGLPYHAAAEKLAWLFREAMRRQISGVNLKDDMALEKPASPASLAG